MEDVAKDGKTNGAEPVSALTTSNGTSSTDAPKVDVSGEVTKPKENGGEEETKKETIDVEEGSFL